MKSRPPWGFDGQKKTPDVLSRPGAKSSSENHSKIANRNPDYEAEKSAVENRQNDRNCESNVDTCCHSADVLSGKLDHEALVSIGLYTVTTSDIEEQEAECQIHYLQSYRTSKSSDLIPILLSNQPPAIPQYIRDIENLTEAELKKGLPSRIQFMAKPPGLREKNGHPMVRKMEQVQRFPA